MYGLVTVIRLSTNRTKCHDCGRQFVAHLQQLYDRIFIPTAVYQELTVDPPVPGIVEVQTLQWLEVRAVSDRAMVEQLQNRAQLDPGESEAIALALEINALRNKKPIQKEVKSNE
jgi:predicted nucleic acid-binding protein